MLGTLRFILAILVVNGHLGTMAWPAAYAVFSFYVISGYLMTLIMNKKYKYSVSGFKLFCLTRFLRIYPPYYVACLISLLIIFLIPGSLTESFNSSIGLPSSLSDIASNFTIFGLDSRSPVRIVPPAWALNIELCYYIAIGIILGKNKKISTVWLILSIAYLPALFGLRPDLFGMFYHRYSTVLDASLPFSVGCCLFHYSEYIQKLTRYLSWKALLIISASFYSSNYIFTYYMHKLQLNFYPYFYLNIIASAFLLYALVNIPKKRLTTYKALDLWLS